MARPQRRTTVEPAASDEIVEAVRGVSHLLDDWQELEPLMARIGDARYVLLGEASHGTHEFYAWRRLISQRLPCAQGKSRCRCFTHGPSVAGGRTSYTSMVP